MSSLPDVTYGFIGKSLLLKDQSASSIDNLPTGIGAMGFPMAQQLRAKMPASSTLIIREVVESQVTRFLDETKISGLIKVAESARAVAQQAVRSYLEVVLSTSSLT